mgnify:CR=1 FL=1
MNRRACSAEIASSRLILCGGLLANHGKLVAYFWQFHRRGLGKMRTRLPSTRNRPSANRRIASG